MTKQLVTPFPASWRLAAGKEASPPRCGTAVHPLMCSLVCQMSTCLHCSTLILLAVHDHRRRDPAAFFNTDNAADRRGAKAHDAALPRAAAGCR